MNKHTWIGNTIGIALAILFLGIILYGPINYIVTAAW